MSADVSRKSSKISSRVQQSEKLCKNYWTDDPVAYDAMAVSRKSSLPVKHEWTQCTVVHPNHKVQKRAFHMLQIADGCVAVASSIEFTLSLCLCLRSTTARCSSAVDTTTDATAAVDAHNVSSSSNIIYHSSWLGMLNSNFFQNRNSNPKNRLKLETRFLFVRDEWRWQSIRWRGGWTVVVRAKHRRRRASDM